MNKIILLVLILASSCAHLKKDTVKDCTEAKSSKKVLTDKQEQVPLYSHAPLYPRRALELKLEGCVLAQFDIDDQGKTENIIILTAKPRGVGLEREAKNALKRWRYQKIEQKNVKTILHFKLSK